jgi:glycine oxidase
MKGLEGRPVHIAGAGILGLATAHELAKAGARVTLFDCRDDGASASAVAAGMLAPAFEACLDPVSRPHYRLFREARDFWPDFAVETGIDLVRSGANYRGSEADAVAAGLEALGAPSDRRPDFVFTAEDWRVDPGQALPALRQALDSARVRTTQQRLEVPDPAVQTVVATGWKSHEWAPETDFLTTIKGHILTIPGVHRGDVVERTRGGYVCPSAAGLRLGATMEAGRSDLKVDLMVAGALFDRLAPPSILADQSARIVQVGIRAATADGLPMVGPSARSGVWLAVGARRNGWLLAPLVARMTAAYLAGDDPGPWSQALHPGRFEGSTGE